MSSSNNEISKIYEDKYQAKIEELLKIGGVGRHSLFQLKYFIIGKEPTHQSKMWRCLSEIESRSDQLENISLEEEDLNDKIKLLNIERKKLLKVVNNDNSNYGIELDELAKEEIEVKLSLNARKNKKLLKSQQKLEKKKTEIQQEIIFFTEAYYSLEKKEELKAYDDVNSQTEYWNEKISQDLNLRMLLGKPLDIEMVKTALSLNEKAQVKQELLTILENAKKISLEKHGR